MTDEEIEKLIPCPPNMTRNQKEARDELVAMYKNSALARKFIGVRVVSKNTRDALDTWEGMKRAKP